SGRRGGSEPGRRGFALADGPRGAPRLRALPGLRRRAGAPLRRRAPRGHAARLPPAPGDGALRGARRAGRHGGRGLPVDRAACGRGRLARARLRAPRGIPRGPGAGGRPDACPRAGRPRGVPRRKGAPHARRHGRPLRRPAAGPRRAHGAPASRLPPEAARMTLEERLRAQIAKEGPISFHDFMEAALYDPHEGYYARGPAIGPQGDFSTSVRFPAFRRAMARLVAAARDALPGPFRVVELGAGTGELARAILAEHPGLDYATVDASPGLRAKQAAAGARPVASAEMLSPAPGLVFGNEVLDALPVRRGAGAPDGGLLEVAVDVDARTGRFRERLVPLRDAEVEARLAREGVWPQRGQILDVAPGLEAFVRAAARLPDPGFLVFIDYGDPAPALYSPQRLNGTLAAYKAQGRFQEPLEEPGQRDLTADVDFTAVEHAAREAGMEPLGLATQQEFLDALGIADLGLPDEVRAVAGAAGLGSAFHVAAFRRGTRVLLPGF